MKIAELTDKEPDERIKLMSLICLDQKWSHGRGYFSNTSQFHENERYPDKNLYYPYSNMHFEAYFGHKK